MNEDYREVLRELQDKCKKNSENGHPYADLYRSLGNLIEKMFEMEHLLIRLEEKSARLTESK